MRDESSENVKVLLKLPDELNNKLKTRAKRESRSRHAQIIFILERYFSAQVKGKQNEK